MHFTSFVKQGLDFIESYLGSIKLSSKNPNTCVYSNSVALFAKCYSCWSIVCCLKSNRIDYVHSKWTDFAPGDKNVKFLSLVAEFYSFGWLLPDLILAFRLESEQLACIFNKHFIETPFAFFQPYLRASIWNERDWKHIFSAHERIYEWQCYQFDVCLLFQYDNNVLGVLIYSWYRYSKW